MRGARTSLLLAMAIAAVMLFARLGQLPLRDPDEGRNAEVAREMAEAGAWLTPTYNGLVYLDKPAFYFKTVAISFRVFGESEWAARLPSALFAVGILAMTFRFCRKEYDELTARLAIIVVASTPSFFALARHVIFDMTLAFFVSGAIFAGYFAEAIEGSRRRNWYLSRGFRGRGHPCERPSGLPGSGVRSERLQHRGPPFRLLETIVSPTEFFGFLRRYPALVFRTIPPAP